MTTEAALAVASASGRSTPKLLYASASVPAFPVACEATSRVSAPAVVLTEVSSAKARAVGERGGRVHPGRDGQRGRPGRRPPRERASPDDCRLCLGPRGRRRDQNAQDVVPAGR